MKPTLVCSALTGFFGAENLTAVVVTGFRVVVVVEGVVEVVVDGIANKENSLDVLQSLHLCELIPRLDLVVADEKCVELHTWLQIKFLNVVV